MRKATRSWISGTSSALTTGELERASILLLIAGEYLNNGEMNLFLCGIKANLWFKNHGPSILTSMQQLSMDVVVTFESRGCVGYMCGESRNVTRFSCALKADVCARDSALVML